MADTTYTNDAAVLDGKAVAADADPLQLIGGVYNDGIAALTTGDAGMLRVTSSRAAHVNLRDASGTEITTGIQYVESDALAADAAQGTLVVARRDDALSALTPVEGDAIGLRVGDKGALWVQISDGSGAQITTFPVSGTVTADAGTGPWPVTDNAGSLTIDNAALSVTGGGTQATALRVTIASDSTGVLSVDDNAGSLTVDGTVTANAGTGPWPVTDNGGSLTVDGSVTADPTASGTGTTSNVAGSVSSVTLKASNSNRLGLSIHNDSTAVLYVKLGSTASTSSYTVRMVAQAHYEVPYHYTGVVDGIWDSATGNARVTEFT